MDNNTSKISKLNENKQIKQNLTNLSKKKKISTTSSNNDDQINEGIDTKQRIKQQDKQDKPVQVSFTK